jgi:hypothetical protein
MSIISNNNNNNNTTTTTTTTTMPLPNVRKMLLSFSHATYPLNPPSALPVQIR